MVVGLVIVVDGRDGGCGDGRGGCDGGDVTGVVVVVGVAAVVSLVQGHAGGDHLGACFV